MKASFQSDRENIILCIMLSFALMAAVFVVYLPGKDGPFLADDFPNILDNSGIQLHSLSLNELSAAWSANNSSGPLKRPVASLSFALNYYFSDQKFNPIPFRLTNIAIHAVNGILLFFCVLFLIRAYDKSAPAKIIAFWSALIWSLHPLQLTSVLYVVQRMNSLACLFMLVGFLVFLKGRMSLNKPTGYILMWGGAIGGTILGGLCKENALLLPLLIFISEVTLLPSIDCRKTRLRLLIYYSIIAIIPVLILIGYYTFFPKYLLQGYTVRNFNLIERLLTEARVLFYYLRLLFYPDNTELSLAHDDFLISRGLFLPKTTFFAVVCVFFLIGVAINSNVRKKYAFASFSILWFLVGHLMESTVFPLELVYEHRNYLPSIGVIIGFVFLSYKTLEARASKLMVNSFYISIAISVAFVTYARAAVWSNTNSFTYFEVRNHPESMRANSAYAKNLELRVGANPESYSHLIKASQLDMFEVSTLIDMFIELNSFIHSLDIPQVNENVVLPSRYDDPLVLEKNYIESLMQLVNDEIMRRLADKTFSLRTMTSIRSAANCVIDQHHMCQGIGPSVLQWIAGAINQPGFSHVPMMYLIQAKINFFLGNQEQAWDGLNQAISLYPTWMYLRAEKAHLYVVLNDFEKAEQTLQEAEALGVATGHDLKEFQKLRDVMSSLKAGNGVGN
ncbi:hypothetical protein NP603_04335 [Methylomonas sp. SURF-1]|uniref:Tetratricopeptide repeat protein n=1 Tax=Methylomonas aurea TaxID=2952224 RepID=A0ABT1UDW4_9GAMM|nr:hypothetical protein [Methylomonas sp. SURF-1]MCQ8180327.1 hypothetical protein [Methylomonas sp. SURF-1]